MMLEDHVVNFYAAFWYLLFTIIKCTRDLYGRDKAHLACFFQIRVRCKCP